MEAVFQILFLIYYKYLYFVLNLRKLYYFYNFWEIRKFKISKISKKKNPSLDEKFFGTIFFTIQNITELHYFKIIFSLICTIFL